MKELSIEEKAKAYDEFLERAKESMKDGGISSNTIAYLESIFPELAESEDEKIRKEIINFIATTPKAKQKHHSWIAWLEKQGEEIIPLKEFILNVWEIGNYWKELTKGVCNTEHGTQLDYTIKHWKEGEHYSKFFNKEGEQKLVNKVEPKFKEGRQQ